MSAVLPANMGDSYLASGMGASRNSLLWEGCCSSSGTAPSTNISARAR